MDVRPAPRILPACDYCHTKKTRCDRQSPCSNCVVAKMRCLRHRPRQVTQNKNNERLDAVLAHMARLEETIRQSSSGKAVSSERSSVDVTPAAETAVGLDNDAVSNATPTPGQPENSLSSIEDHPPKPPLLSKRRRERSVDHATSDQDDRDPESRPTKWPRTLTVDLTSSVHDEDDTIVATSNKDGEGEAGHSPEDKILANLDLDRYLRLDRQNNCHLDRERQNVLDAAIKLAKSVAVANPRIIFNRDRKPNFYDPSMYPTAEFLHLMTREISKRPSLAYSMVHFATVSLPVLEDMAFALINNTVHEQRRIQYLICINHVAYAFLMASYSSVDHTSPAMKRELRAARQRYFDNITAGIAYLDLSIRPDQYLLYALQSSAMLMQGIGRMRQCWRFNHLACQVAAALSNEKAPGCALTKEEAKLLRVSYIRSYAFNAALSANIYQPAAACSVRMHIDRSVLDTERPEDAMLETLLSIAEVQEVIIQETKNCINQQQRFQMNRSRVANLTHQMRSIRCQIEGYRSDVRSSTDDFMQFEWLAVDVVFYSTMTSILRLAASGRPGAADTHAHFSCLENARKCLTTLKSLLVLWEHSKTPELYSSSLAWVIPLFPLRPLYFIFTNVIATSDALDIKLLEDIASGLAMKADTSPAVFEIHRLCVSLLDLNTRYTDHVMLSQISFKVSSDQLRPEAHGAHQQDASSPTHGKTTAQLATSHEPSPSLLVAEQSPNQPAIFPALSTSTAITATQNIHHHDVGFPEEQDNILSQLGSPWDPSFFDQPVDWDFVYGPPASSVFP